MSNLKSIDPLIAVRLGEVLVSLRYRKNLSQEEAANRALLSRNYYQLLERGLSTRRSKSPANPTLAVLMKLADTFEISVSELIEEVLSGYHATEDGDAHAEEDRDE